MDSPFSPPRLLSCPGTTGAFHFLILLAKGSSSKSSKARRTGFAERNALEPGEQPGHIDRGSSSDMLPMRLGQAKIASLSSVKGSHPLRDGAFNPRSYRVALFKRRRLLPVTGELNGLKLRLWTHHELTGIGESRGTRTWARTGPTILLAKLEANPLRDRALLLDRPLATRVPLRTSGTLGLPINAKASMINALSSFGLPTGATGDRPKELAPRGLLTAHQMRCIHIARVHHLFCGEELLVCQSLLDGCGHLHILGGGRRRFHMDEQVRSRLITGFGQVDLVAGPHRAACDAQMRVGVVGRAKKQRGGSNGVVASPAELAFVDHILLHPHAPQPLNGRNFPHPRRGTAVPDGTEQIPAIRSDLLSHGLALAGFFGH